MVLNTVEGLMNVQGKDATELRRARKAVDVVGNTEEGIVSGYVVAESSLSKRESGCVGKVPFKSRQCHAFEQFTNTRCKRDGAKVRKSVWFSGFWDENYFGMFPRRRQFTTEPDVVKEGKELSMCAVRKVAEEFIGYFIFTRRCIATKGVERSVEFGYCERLVEGRRRKLLKWKRGSRVVCTSGV